MVLECMMCGAEVRPHDPRMVLAIPPDNPKLSLCDRCAAADPSSLRDNVPAMRERLRRVGLEFEIEHILSALNIMSSMTKLDLSGSGGNERRN